MFRYGLWLCAGACALLACAADDAMKSMPDGPGKDALVKMCSQCHGTDNIRKLRLDKDGWADQVSDMLDRGAQGSDADIAAVTDYLAANFGPHSKVLANTAPLAEWKAVLGFTTDEAKAIVAWREQNGDFTGWRDLLKVPGIDPAKVEAKKDQMAF
jgi:competence ComEA-like helix-hairpin-helix protein